MPEHKITALVTGASAGLGAEFCRQLAQRCDVIIAVARRGERLTALAEELVDAVELHRVEADLGTIEGVASAMEAIRQQGPVDYLVNNAGFSSFGHFADLPIDSQRDMVNLHIDTGITLCRAAVPFMRELGGGYIINVCSLEAFLPGKGLAVYGATKAFLVYYSQALQAELAGTGIAVQALCPGYTHTDFHQPMAEVGFEQRRIPDEMWMNADEVVAASLAALAGGRVLVVPGDGNQTLARMGLQQQLDALQ
ncbi:MAG: SDR family NAD(P)-dependent oxidoreductase [Gammaproteobacteria bacterium]|nr:MAG: SDR family NAD(P)-dependent oxidoreductase [Gammaproteobacteria bacterium]RLA58033.1 MAG: SDR family NAD(P)-dependent oxidoreductase [Gammaproteobacteria bacterium]